jgi:SMC interacting uncharacterized protein involved in chromosome segregation
MWKQVLTLVKQLITLARDTDQNKSDIRELRQEFDELTDKVQWLVFELSRIAERDAHEREKLALRLENELLRFERRLPEGKHKS